MAVENYLYPDRGLIPNYTVTPSIIDKISNIKKKHVGIETLKGIMLEGMEVFEGFSESTIRIEPEYETAEESRRDILEFLENPMFKK